MAAPTPAAVCLAACAEKLPPDLRPSAPAPPGATLEDTHAVLRAALATSYLGPTRARSYMQSRSTAHGPYAPRANGYGRNVVGLFGWHVAVDPRGAALALQTTLNVLDKNS